jgi:hypothetical protein
MPFPNTQLQLFSVAASTSAQAPFVARVPSELCFISSLLPPFINIILIRALKLFPPPFSFLYSTNLDQQTFESFLPARRASMSLLRRSSSCTMPEIPRAEAL